MCGNRARSVAQTSQASRSCRCYGEGETGALQTVKARLHEVVSLTALAFAQVDHQVNFVFF
jgi:hypothetical protein